VLDGRENYQKTNSLHVVDIQPRCGRKRMVSAAS